MPDFDGTRKWLDRLDINQTDRSRLKSWVDKMQGAYVKLEREIDGLERALSEAAYEADRVAALEDAIERHRLGILDTDELYRLAADGKLMA